MTNTEMLKATSGHDTDAQDLPPVYIDTETTGLDPRGDEIIEIAIIDHSEAVLLDTFVKPVHVSQWPEAQAINGISPEMVQNAPLLKDIAQQIKDAVKDRDAYMWNAIFDTQFLAGLLDHVSSINCAMYEYADYIERTQPQNMSHSGRYKLEYTANDLGIQVEGDAHRAKHDVIKTIRVRKAWMETDRTDLSGNINTAPYKT